MVDGETAARLRLRVAQDARRVPTGMPGFRRRARRLSSPLRGGSQRNNGHCEEENRSCNPAVSESRFHGRRALHKAQHPKLGRRCISEFLPPARGCFRAAINATVPTPIPELCGKDFLSRQAALSKRKPHFSNAYALRKRLTFQIPQPASHPHGESAFYFDLSAEGDQLNGYGRWPTHDKVLSMRISLKRVAQK
jgi:hypothetical protein